jgi:hypothetical protein
MKDIILDEAYRGITVRDGDRNVTIPMAQAVIRALAVNAAKGDHRSQRLFAELLASVESSRKLLHDQWLDTAIGYKVEWEKELHRREHLGITDLPEPLPHPDHVQIDFIAGTAAICRSCHQRREGRARLVPRASRRVCGRTSPVGRRTCDRN